MTQNFTLKRNGTSLSKEKKGEIIQLFYGINLDPENLSKGLMDERNPIRDGIVNNCIMHLILFYNMKLANEKKKERNRIMGLVSHKLKNQIHAIRVPVQNLIESSKKKMKTA